MLNDGWDVHYVQLIDCDDAPYYRAILGEAPGNPGGLPNVRHCWLHRLFFEDSHPELTELVEAVDPDVVIGFGYLAVGLLKTAAPSRRVVFVTGNCAQAQDHVTSKRARDAVSLGQALASGMRPRVINHLERRAVEECDLLITHSPQTLQMMRGFFPAALGRIYPSVISFAEWVVDGALPWRHVARPFQERDIDVLFVASDWGRIEKNYAMVEAIGRRLGDARVHVVGDVPARRPSVTYHGFIASRETIFDLFGRARSVACPSRIDAAPGVLFEAAAIGCNVVTSKNCGNWEISHPHLVAEPYGPDTFVACIRRAMVQKYEDRLESLLRRRSYDDLLALVTAFARPSGMFAFPTSDVSAVVPR
jgi:glycosyltransferase involved in cell wall biosynthesis